MSAKGMFEEFFCQTLKEPDLRHMRHRLDQIITIAESNAPAEEAYATVCRLAWNAVSPEDSPLTPEDEALIEKVEASFRITNNYGSDGSGGW